MSVGKLSFYSLSFYSDEACRTVEMRDVRLREDLERAIYESGGCLSLGRFLPVVFERSSGMDVIYEVESWAAE